MSIRTLPILLFVGLLLVVCSGQSGADNGPKRRTTSDSVSINATDLVVVIIANAGVQRVRMDPVILFTDESGWNLRFKKLTRVEAKQAEGIECNGAALARLLLSVKARHGFVDQGEYGNTELTFCRRDSRLVSFVLDRRNTTAAFEDARTELPKDTRLWKYLAIINREFPPAPKTWLPPKQ